MVTIEEAQADIDVYKREIERGKIEAEQSRANISSQKVLLQTRGLKGLEARQKAEQQVSRYQEQLSSAEKEVAMQEQQVKQVQSEVDAYNRQVAEAQAEARAYEKARKMFEKKYPMD